MYMEMQVHVNLDSEAIIICMSGFLHPASVIHSYWWLFMGDSCLIWQWFRICVSLPLSLSPFPFLPPSLSLSLSLPLSLSSPLPSPLFYPFVFTHAHTKTSWWITIIKIITTLHVVFQVVLNLQKRYKYRYLLLVHTLVLCHLLIVMYSCIERKFLLRGCWLPLNRSFVTQHLWSLPIRILLA